MEDFIITKDDVFYSDKLNRWYIGKNLSDEILRLVMSIDMSAIERKFFGSQVYINTETNLKYGYNFMITYLNIQHSKNIDNRTINYMRMTIKFLSDSINLKKDSK